MPANVFTLPLGVPFLEALARAILKGDLPAPGGPAPDILSLPNMTLLLPTRRAARATREAFLAAAGTRAVIMPRIRPISQGEDDLSLIANLAEGDLSGAAALEQPPSIDALDRTLVLMQLVARWRQTMAKSDTDSERTSGSTPAQAAQLAAELAKLMDDIERENASLSGIKDLVPETYAAALAKDGRVPEDRHRTLAELSRGRRSDIARGAAQRVDPRGSRAHHEAETG